MALLERIREEQREVRSLRATPGWKIFEEAAVRLSQIAMRDLRVSKENVDIFRAQGRIDSVHTLMKKIEEFAALDVESVVKEQNERLKRRAEERLSAEAGRKRRQSV